MRVVAGEQRWEWVRPAAGDERFAHGGGGYLRLKDVARMHRSPAAGRDSDGRGRAAQGADAQDLEALEELELEDDELQQADVTGLPSLPQPQLHMYEYHVVHSNSYGVPVLYLRGRTAGGKAVPTQSVWDDLCAPNTWPHPHNSGRGVQGADALLLADDWLTDSGLPTPAAHPVSGEAFLIVHPCRTHDFMCQALSFSPTLSASATQPTIELSLSQARTHTHTHTHTHTAPVSIPLLAYVVECVWGCCWTWVAAVCAGCCYRNMTHSHA
mmetsp:Transcript_49438/g.72518  ORF Transcript_49438/g.72518 Transcript_49438/m.72518 type:complete len:269 (-) Transcript_49438:79-885(-)